LFVISFGVSSARKVKSLARKFVGNLSSDIKLN